MDPQSRYIIARSEMAERHAEAARARLVKAERSSEPRPVVVTGSTGPFAGLRGRLAGLRSIGAHRPSAPVASPAR